MIGIRAVNTISFKGEFDATGFKGKTDEEKQETAKKVVEGGGASALVAKGAMSKARKGGFDMFSNKNLSNISTETRNAIKTVKNATDAMKMAKGSVKKSQSLFGICKRNAKNVTNDIMKWAERMKSSKLLKPILGSKVFMKFAGFLGYGFGLMSLASGLTDIAAATTDIYTTKFADKNN